MEGKDGYDGSNTDEPPNRANSERKPCGASIYSRAIDSHALELNQWIAQAAAMLSETESSLKLEAITLQSASDLAEIEYAVHRAAICLAGPKCAGEDDKPHASRILRLRAQLFGFVHRYIFYSNCTQISELSKLWLYGVVRLVADTTR